MCIGTPRSSYRFNADAFIGNLHPFYYLYLIAFIESLKNFVIYRTNNVYVINIPP